MSACGKAAHAALVSAGRRVALDVEYALCRKSTSNHARIAVFYDDAQGSARRGRARKPSSDGALRHDPACRCRHLHVDAAGPARAAQGRGDRARGNEPRRCDRAPDAGDPAGGAMAGIGALGQIRPRPASHQGPPPARLRRAADVRRGHHRHRAQGAQELQAVAGQPVSHSDQVSRRGAPALRRNAFA